MTALPVLLAIALFTSTAIAAPFESQWGLHNTGQRVCRFDGQNCMDGRAGADIRAKAAWTQNKDCRPIVIAVLDSGVDQRHPDLVGNLLRGVNFVPSVPTRDPQDDNLHGTHVIGIIAGTGNESRGVAGVCPRARILPLKVGDAAGYLTDADVLEGIRYAVREGAKVVNASFGGGPQNQIMKSAMSKASNTLFVAAAGNGDFTGRGFDIDSQPVYPASYALSNVIAVAATDSQDNLAFFSNYGVKRVHLAAPGMNIMSTLPLQATADMQTFGIPTEIGAIEGTSMATPFVTGAIALYWSRHPSLRAVEVKRRLLLTTDKLPSLAGKVQSGGRLNLARLMGAAP